MSKSTRTKRLTGAFLIGAVIGVLAVLPVYLSAYSEHTARSARAVNDYLGRDFTVWWLGPDYEGQRASATISVKRFHRLTDRAVVVSYGDASRGGISVATHPAKDYGHGQQLEQWWATGQTALGPSYYRGPGWSGSAGEPAQLVIVLAGGEFLTLSAGVQARHRDFIPLIRVLSPTRSLSVLPRYAPVWAAGLGQGAAASSH